MMSVVAAVTGWIFAAEAHGVVPIGRYDATPHADWPLTSAHAAAIRRDALTRAAVLLREPHRAAALSRASAAVDPRPAAQTGSVDTLTCRYLAEEPSGTSPKFNCVLDGGEIIKVKYGRNPEIHAEAAATRLLARLGFAADEVRIVPRVRCYGCPRFPFLTTQLLTLVRLPAVLSARNEGGAYTDFEWVAVEHRFQAAAIATPTTSGWAWFELAASQAPRADLDAFRLLAVFLAHWDNKSENQRLVCMDNPPPHLDQRCKEPMLMIQDLGATFGPVKANVSGWRHLPVWIDRETCTVSMRSLPYQGATFPDARISEAGRSQLARALSALSIDEITALFRDARFPEFQSGTDDRRDLDAWVSAFRYRVDQIVHRERCRES